MCAALANEARVLQHLEGVSVVPQVLAVGTLLHAASWSPSILMTRVLGQRLDELLSPGQPLSVADRRWLYEAVLDGVAELHSRGVIHGDWDGRHILVDVAQCQLCQLYLSLWQFDTIAHAKLVHAKLVLHDASGNSCACVARILLLQFGADIMHMPYTKTRLFRSSILTQYDFSRFANS